MAEKIASRKRSTRKPRASKVSPSSNGKGNGSAGVAIPRATTGFDEDDVLVSGGGRAGTGFGRCGGRVLSTRLEQHICTKLSLAGVTHCHSPRHFEVRLADGSLAAYAPMIVLRGRGRQGKTVVVEAVEEIRTPMIEKIRAFRELHGAEFYVMMVAPEEIIDEIPLAAYDESCTTVDLPTLVSRLAE